MLLFGLFNGLPLSSDFNGRKRLFEHFLRPRLNADSSTLNRGFCGYAMPTYHDILDPIKFEF